MQVGKGAYGEMVVLLGIGAISRHLLALLKPFNLRIIAVSGHIAGSTNDEVQRMADFALDDFRRWINGDALHYAVDSGALARRA
jgi:phosphoglycerate dehydrogenase-like enzyme